MNDKHKTKQQLIKEVTELRSQLQALTLNSNHSCSNSLNDTFQNSPLGLPFMLKTFKLLNKLPIPIIITTYPESQFIAVNDSFVSLSGYSRNEALDSTVTELSVWQNSISRENLLKQINLTGSAQDFEASFITKTGKIKFGLCTSTLFTFDNKKYLLTSIIDITALKKTELALSNSQQTTHLLNKLPDMLFRVSTNGTILDFYGSNTEQLYRPKEQIIDKHINDLLPPEVSKKIMAAIENAASNNNETINYELTINNNLYFFEARLLACNDTETLFIVRDITELSLLRQELMRLDQLNLVGEMAASIGHEVRNPMTTVRGFLQMLSLKEECLPFKEYFELMIEELDRANAIISEFLSLAKNKPISFETYDLNAIITALAPLIQSDAIMSNKYLKLELNSIPPLLLDDKEIRQLILNFARNGLEAMRAHSSLTIKTYRDGKHTVLAIKDEGSGIPPELLENLGSPFFTTKENGTGLGLAICYNIAARHNATIEVDTSPAGTTFYIKFN